MNAKQSLPLEWSEYAISARDRLQELQKEIAKGGTSSSPYLLLSNFAHNANCAGVGQVLAEALHGGFGSHLAQVTWQILEEGIEQLSGEEDEAGYSEPHRISFGTLCIHLGAIDALRSVVQSRWPDIVPSDIMPSTESQWLNLLCSTQSEREHAMFDPSAGLAALTAEVAASKGGQLEHGYAAMELALEVDPEHSDIDELIDDESAEGAYVRQFLMDRKISASTNETGLVPKDAPGQRRNRAL